MQQSSLKDDLQFACLKDDLQFACRLNLEYPFDPGCDQQTRLHLNLLKSLLNTIPSPVFFKDLDGRYLGCNLAFEEFTGLLCGQIAGRRPTEIEGWKMGSEYELSDIETLKSHGPHTYRTKINNIDGRVMDIEVHKAVFRDSQGKAAGLVGILVDITGKLAVEENLRSSKLLLEDQVAERTRELEDLNRALKHDIQQRQEAEEAMALGEAKFRMLFENMALGVVYHGEGGWVKDANPAAQKILGLTLEQMRENHPRERNWRITKEDGSRMDMDEHPVMQALRTGELVGPVVLGVHNYQDKQIRWLQVSVRPCIGHGVDGPREVFSTFEDITEIKLQAEQIAHDRDFTRTVLDTVDAIVVVQDAQGNIVSINREGLRISGYRTEELVGGTVWEKLIVPEEMQAVEMVFKNLTLGSPSQIHEHHWLTKDGELRLIAWSNTVLQGADGRIEFVIGTGLDVTERREAEDFMALASKVFENVIEGVTVTDVNGNIQFVNRAFCIITGYSPEEAVGKNPSILKSDRHPPEFYQKMWDSIKRYGEWHGEIWNRRRNGEAYPEWLAITAVKDSKGVIQRYVAVFHDISEIKHSQEQVEFYSNHDALTGLPNRDLFKARLQSAMMHSRDSGQKLAVLAVDIDDFKHYNDTLGHVAGDRLLQLVGKRLQEALGSHAALTRMGGDQFFALAEKVNDAAQAAQLAQTIINAVGRGFSLSNRELYLTVSIGIAMTPLEEVNPDVLIINADLAMHRAKEQGKNTYWFYTSEMNTLVHKRFEMESDLRKALDRKEFVLLYQPKVDLFSGQVTGMEALIRWRKRDGTVLPPVEFIPLAEQTGQIVAIGQWVLQEACRQTQLWLERFGVNLRVAVNLSVNQFRDQGLYHVVKNTLMLSGLPASSLELELTESALMQDTEEAIATMRRITDLGVQFALDDFGTGYSSLAYLQRLPMSSLKVDKSFVDNTPGDKGSATIVATIIAMAHATRMRAVAEGVETREQLSFLRGLNCDEIQGYLFSRPLTAEQFEEMIREGRTLHY